MLQKITLKDAERTTPASFFFAAKETRLSKFDSFYKKVKFRPKSEPLFCFFRKFV